MQLISYFSCTNLQRRSTMKFRLIALFLVLTFAVIVAPVMADAVPGDGSTCTSNPDDGSNLPECGTPDDNECNPGGVLYREENQDGCKTLWYWKAGWYLARFNDGKISRENFPIEFESVLPPPVKVIVPVSACKITIGGPFGVVPVPAPVLARDASTIFPNIYDDGAHTWSWHNGVNGDDLGFEFIGLDVHVYRLGTGWSYPTTGNCTVNEP